MDKIGHSIFSVHNSDESIKNYNDTIDLSNNGYIALSAGDF